MKKHAAYTLSGKIVHEETKTGIPGLRVEAWDKDLFIDDLLGNAVSRKDGSFEIDFDERFYSEIIFDRKPDIYLKVFRDDELIVNTQKTALWNVSDLGKVIVIEIGGAIPEGPELPFRFSVKGVITDSLNQPVAGLVVKAFDRDLRSEQLLGMHRTDENGQYKINYTRENFSRAEKETADLAVKVFGRDGKELIYAPTVDEIVFNADAHVTVDIQLNTTEKPVENEFAVITRCLIPLLDGVSIADLAENDELHDITILNKETDIEPTKLDHIAVAHKLADRSGIIPAFFYGLLRMDTLLNTNVTEVFSLRLHIDVNTDIGPLLYDVVLTDQEVMQADLDTAANDMIIPTLSEEELRYAFAKLEKLRDEAEDYSQNQKPRVLMDLLSEFVTSDKLGDLLGMISNPKGDFSSFFADIANADIFKSADDRGKATTNLAIAEVLGFDNQIISAVREKQGITKPEEVSKLAAMNRSEWKTILTDCADEITIAGAPMNKDLIDMHASNIVRKMELRFPTVAFAAQLKRGSEPQLRNHDALVKLFSEHEDLDLQSTNIELFFKEQNLNTPESESVKQELKSIQRIFKLIPNYSKTNALLKHNIHSAQGIVATGRSRFIQEIAPKVGLTQREALAVFERAETVQTAAMLIVGDIQESLSSMDIAALESTSLPMALEAISEDFPNLKSLFKLTDLCACEHCRSVYSPAAYLVEILQFLDKRSVVDLTTTPATTGRLAKDVLFERRTDLGDLDLNCANATTPLPYIDLVNELLEEAVSPDPGIAYTGAIVEGSPPADLLTLLQNEGIPVTDRSLIFKPDVNGDYILRDENAVCKLIDQGSGTDWIVKRLRQTHGTAAELAAAPEYVNAAAYTTLANSDYAFKLPFNLDHVEASAYFSRFDIERAQLMLDFRNGAGPDARTIVAEKLGLTDVERQLIITPDAANQDLYWNFPAATVADDMKVVDTFLTKTGLTYNELEILLQLEFIDPNGVHFIRHLDTSCDTTKKEIADLDTDALDRIHRFLRLMKKTGWNMELLNEVIMQPRLGQGQLNDNCLIRMSELVRLHEVSDVKLEELVGCYSEIPHIEYLGSDQEPLYQSVFQNKAANGFIEEGLAPENIDGSVSLTDSSISTALAASLQLSQQDFETLVAEMANTDLIFENLSWLYAMTRFSKKLKLSIDDMLLYQTLTSLDVFLDPAVTLEFVERMALARTSPLGATDIQYMLMHKATDLDARTITDEKITTFLENLQDTYQAAFDDTRSPYNDELTLEEHRESFKNSLLTIPGVVEEDANMFIKIVDMEWTAPPTEAEYIDSKLAALFDTTEIQSKLTDLKTAVSPTLDSERKALIKAFVDAISAYRYGLQKISALTTLLATTFNVEEDHVTAILDAGVLIQPGAGTTPIAEILCADALIDSVNIPPLPPTIDLAGFSIQYGALRLLHKVFPLTDALGLDARDLTWLMEHSGDFGWMRVDGIPYETGHTALPYTDWEALLQTLSVWKQQTPVLNPADAANPITFTSAMELLIPGTISIGDWLDALALLTGYDRDELGLLDTHFSYSAGNLDAYKTGYTWIQIAKSMDYLRTLGVSVTRVQEFTKASLTATDTQNLRLALKARYDENLWLTTLGEITDTIRPQKRDALVAFLLAVNSDMKDENSLYDYFLVDVEMEACMPSSRIVQAHGVVQLFVQRSLMGLEPTASADVSNDKSWDQWQWMRMYRVWEANRKVFLYPENWIEPELLDNKSYLFSDLENELLQNELNEFTTEDALFRYLERLDEIAFLEVVASYYQADIYTTHVFARTKGGDPAQYYYRKFEKERAWTPWEPVDLDITSDHLLAFVRNNRLHLAWPIFSEEPNPVQVSVVPPISSTSSSTQTVGKPSRRLKIQLAMSELANGIWKPKKISQDAITTPEGYTHDNFNTRSYVLMYNQFVQQIIVFHTIKKGEYEFHQLDGIFDVAGCKGYPELVSTQQADFSDFFPDIKDALLQVQRYIEQDIDVTNELSIRTVLSFSDFVDRLRITPGTFRISYPLQFTMIDMIAYLFQILLLQVLGSGRQLLDRSAALVLPRYLKIPFGTLLPYFFEDSEHAYTVVPGFYGVVGGTGDEDVEVKRTYSDILKLVEDIIALFSKYLKKLQEDPNQDLGILLQEFITDPDLQTIVDELRVYGTLEPGEQYKNLYHPLLCYLRTTLYKDGIKGFMDRATQLFVNEDFDFDDHYEPNPAAIAEPYPIEDLDFNSDGSYSSYNWEMFYHIPMMIANRLSQDQKFEEAMNWYHYMFNPTGTLEGTTPQKYWVTKPFFLATDADYAAQRIDTLLYRIADPTTPERKELEFAIEEWRDKPFRPHTVARFRPVAYQKALLMKYIDNLVEWGDYNFRQDTMESITQATQLYILADKLLGTKPRVVDPPVTVPHETYNQIEVSLDAFGNALVEFENLIPDLSVLPQGGNELPPAPITLSSLYFCVPQNDNMLEYWSRIEDRLFKIRNCQNIDGVERALALFAPPIDPGMLVRAAAAGLSISSVLAGLNAPLPPYRFNILSQKATELSQEVRTLGNSLLQALEKKDAEAMALLRNDLEIKTLKASRTLKELAIEEADEQIEVLNKTKAVTEERQKFYAEVERINANEQLNLDKLSEAQDFQLAAQIVRATGGVLGLIPDFSIGGHGAGGSPAVHATFGGSFLAEVANAAAGVLDIFAGIASYEASRASTLGSYDRRFDDWELQERLATKELEQIDQQIVAAELRLRIAESDLEQHDIQIENSEQVGDFMRDKYTNKELYNWMINQISSVYFKAYQLAYDTAKKAEHCYQHELGTTDTFLEFGYWDSLKKGLQAADHLIHDIKRMEVSYLDKNKREYELTKHISLAMLDPLALVRLKATDSCDFDIPEALYDMDYPGQYFRRIKSVSMSIPCVAGPYTSVSAKLSQITNKYRKNSIGTPAYDEDLGNDNRFIYNVGSIQSVATSNAQSDSGLFELNFRDERYLPFEGTGAVSSWRLELPNEVHQFDHNTITDVIIHVQYVAREGGSSLRALAETSLKNRLSQISQELSKTGMHLAVNVKHEMPNEWHQLKTIGTVNMEITKARLPYFVQALSPTIGTVTFVAKVKDSPASYTVQVDGTDLPLNRNDEWQLCLGETTSISIDTPFVLSTSEALDDLEELQMIVKYEFS